MKISELITRLTQHKTTHGDIEVCLPNELSQDEEHDYIPLDQFNLVVEPILDKCEYILVIT